MRRRPLHGQWLWVASILCILVGVLFVARLELLHSPSHGLPYRDSFGSGKADEWKAFGGTWELVNGAMHNESDERGAKLVTGSPYWHNYSIESDIYLLGVRGDAGLVIRLGNEEEGVNAYSGYYAGIRTSDNSVVLGRADHSWMESHRINPLPGRLQAFTWYHLKLLAFDCQVAAEITTPSLATRASVAVSDSNCLQSGRVGLRSYSSGGMWRNIVVRPATHHDLEKMLREGRHERIFPEQNTTLGNSEDLESRQELQEAQSKSLPKTITESIASLRLTSFVTPAIATVRGVVIQTEPRLYVQDSTGGVLIKESTHPLLKVGDEVEVTGEAQPGDFSSTMDHASVQELWTRTPMPPVSVTASQASTGKYDATFIEVHGHLVGKKREPDNTMVLELDEGPQSFRAIMNPGRSNYLFDQLKPNSRLRLRGICVVDPELTRHLTPFVLLLRSNEDLEVIAGPPWWTTGHVISIFVVGLVLALVAVLFYHRVENWRLRAILEERQRLAHEMHDTLSQSFAGIGFQLQAIRNGLTAEVSTLRQPIELACNLVRHSHEEARRSIATLRTEDLESEDILSALSRCASHMTQFGTVRLVTEKVGDQRSIPLRVADTLFRIGQEAIANAVRHGTPTELGIQLTYKESAISLEVKDNGIGFITGNGFQGFGIRGMRRRAQSISASLQLLSEPGLGTRIMVEAPLPPRVTFFSWPEFLWRYLMEHWSNGSPKRANSYPYR
jgi:signal transduction histidine kinase